MAFFHEFISVYKYQVVKFIWESLETPGIFTGRSKTDFYIFASCGSCW